MRSTGNINCLSAVLVVHQDSKDKVFVLVQAALNKTAILDALRREQVEISGKVGHRTM